MRIMGAMTPSAIQVQSPALPSIFTAQSPGPKADAGFLQLPYSQ
jgi:hypothetical protein